ncbi:MAG TPA: hypothetical protein EYQ20_02445 [candidate division Zixibacteria bacterium]|nr:hypothetical protein [candidate division Zixibacteria bacterium]
MIIIPSWSPGGVCEAEGIVMIIDDTAVLETNGFGIIFSWKSDTRRWGLRRRVYNCCAAACRPVARHFTVCRCPCVLR